MNIYESICKDIEKATKETAAFIISETKGFDINLTEKKGTNDFVSYVDKGSEKMLVNKLEHLLPGAGIIAEEGTSDKKGDKFYWIIDPLDGTTNFLHGLHPYAISVALMEHNEVVAGVVYEVSGGEIFTAWKDGGAWLNGTAIEVSRTKTLAESLIATGFPYNDFGKLIPYMNLLSSLVRNTHGIRRLGSAAIDLAYVACGRFEGFYEYGLHIWDIAAGMLLVKEAGGRTGDFSGNEINLTGEEIIAANNLVFPELLEIVSKFMNI